MLSVCSFTSAINGAYYSKQHDEAIKAGRYTKWRTIRLLSFNFWNLGIRFHGRGLLPGRVKLVKERSYNFDRHFAPHDIKARELGTGKSRLAGAKSLGIIFEIVPQVSVQDRLDDGGRFFSKLWVDKTKCKDWLRATPQYSKAIR
jgi:phage terminase large subunit